MTWCEMTELLLQSFLQTTLIFGAMAEQWASKQHPSPHESSNPPPKTNSQIVDEHLWSLMPMRLRLVRSTSRRRGINWFNCCQPAVTATTPGSSTAAAGCLEPGIELANSIHGSGWFYSGYSGFHPPFFKKIKEKEWKDKKKRLKRI